MALAFTLRADDPDTTNASSYATPAFTPSASAGIVVGVLSSKASAPDLPTLDSPSWLSGAWTQELTVVQAANTSRMTVFSGRTVASPGVAALTVDFAAVTQTGCITQIVDITDVDATDFLLQPKIVEHAAATSASITLDGALAAATSACLAFFSHNEQEAHTPSGGETELADSGHATPTRELSVQFEINDTTSGVTWLTSAVGIDAAMEIKAVIAAGAAEDPFPFLGGGYYPVEG